MPVGSFIYHGVSQSTGRGASTPYHINKRLREFFFKIFREVFASFSQVFASFLRFSELLGPAWTCSDAFGWVWTRLDAFGSVRTRSENFGKIGQKISFSQFLIGF